MGNDKLNKLMATSVVKDYKKTMVGNLQASFPGLNIKELEEAINWAIENNYSDNPVRLDNNYTKQNINGTVVDILGYIDKVQPILTSSGVLYKKHSEIDNPISTVIQGFLKQRKVYKKEMFKHPKGSKDFERFNLLQLLEKLNANASYGKIYAASSW